MNRLALSILTLASTTLFAASASADELPGVHQPGVHQPGMRQPGVHQGLKSESDTLGVCHINWNDNALLRRKGYVRALAKDGMKSSDGRYFIFLTEKRDKALSMRRDLCDDIGKSEAHFYKYSGYRDANGNPWADPKVYFSPKD